MGHRTLAHPFIFTPRPDVAVMVSGNAMANIYVNLAERRRPLWSALSREWTPLLDQLLARPSVDLAIVTDRDDIRVFGGARGEARISADNGRFSYRRETGDPLGLSRDLDAVEELETLDATFSTEYPDSIVQLWHLTRSSRAGDIILSATPGWDFRARFEPIPHVSAHGALHRDHMLVPLIVDRPISGHPRRTTDVMPSALSALGVQAPEFLDGRSFIDTLVAV